jgi:hypothetical protein
MKVIFNAFIAQAGGGGNNGGQIGQKPSGIIGQKKPPAQQF